MKNLRKTIAYLAAGALTLISACESKSAQPSASQPKRVVTVIQGELLEDYVREEKNIYKLALQTNEGIQNCKLSGNIAELFNLEKKLVNRDEADGPRGDEVSIVFHDGEVSPQDVKQVASYARQSQVKLKESHNDYFLSNGMKIPGYVIRGVGDFGKGKAIVVNTGYGSKYDLWIYDENDGKPYRFVSAGSRSFENGELKECKTEREKRFSLTYKFCDKHEPYPIWEPTAFRSDPCYMEAAQKLLKNSSQQILLNQTSEIFK